MLFMPRPSKASPPPIPPLPTGERIAALRKAKGLSQAELAVLMGITRKQITDYETSRVRMNDEMVVRFALALKVSADELLGLADNDTVKEAPPLRLTKRLYELEKLPEQKRKAILKTLDDLIKANS
jgi:transcriptional regulator with XRE-family HTH domain